MSNATEHGYLDYNREERNICAHLFRLLLEDQPEWRPLKQFLGVSEVRNPAVYCEASIIRDAYHVRRRNAAEFVHSLCELTAEQRGIDMYTRFADLPEDICSQHKTHPRQIAWKLKERGLLTADADAAVYGALQGLFNAKPDLVICEGETLWVYEAKFTQKFDDKQMQRTREIADIWACLLHRDLGFSDSPAVEVRRLGLRPEESDITWKDVCGIARGFWNADDFSLRVLNSAAAMAGTN